MARVLVVDDDPWIQRMVSSVLVHGGHTVDLAGDGWEGLVAADRMPPDLLVVDARLPTADGWKLLGTLRSRPEMANMHALILTTFSEQERRGASFRPDLDEVLVSPFRLEDLTARVERLLGGHLGDDDTTAIGLAPEPPPSSSDGAIPQAHTPVLQRTSLAGNLQQFGASSVLMLMDLERRSGVLILSGPEGRGRFYLRHGRILRATVDGRPHLRATTAVHTLVTWTNGHFEFHTAEIEGDDEIRSSTSFLLMESARLQDERSEQAATATKKTSN